MFNPSKRLLYLNQSFFEIIKTVMCNLITLEKNWLKALNSKNIYI